MKLSTLFLLTLSASPLAISARPAAQKGLQQVLGTSPRSGSLSSANSFSTSSDVESNSDSSTKSNGFSSWLSNTLKKPLPKPSLEFKCHRYPKTSILSELSGYITDLLRGYRETILGGKADQEPWFKTCYAGYESTDVSPSIYFRELKTKQLGMVEKLLKNHVKERFPNVEIVTTGNALAIKVPDERPGLKRRNTV